MLHFCSIICHSPNQLSILLKMNLLRSAFVFHLDSFQNHKTNLLRHSTKIKRYNNVKILEVLSLLLWNELLSVGLKTGSKNLSFLKENNLLTDFLKVTKTNLPIPILGDKKVFMKSLNHTQTKQTFHSFLFARNSYKNRRKSPKEYEQSSERINI